MAEALGLARGALGRVWPNPAVGCVLVRDGAVVGRGATQPGGRPHAEVVALEAARPHAEGATAYVSLEPCAHYGRTPPCADALVRARVSRCVIATLDPDPRVDGKGRARLEAAGIEVELGLYGAEAREVNAGFFLRVQEGRPLVTILAAERVDALGAGHDAVLGLDPGRTGVWAEVRGTGVTPLRWWLGGEVPVGERPWRRFGCPIGAAGPDPASVLGQLGAQGLTRVVVNAGDPWSEQLRRAGLVDREQK